MPSIKYEFEEIQPRNSVGKPISGIMLYGMAELKPSRDYDPHDPDLAFEFFVEAITIEGGNRISRGHAKAHPGSPDAFFFNAVAGELENGLTQDGKLAQTAWDDAVEKEAEEYVCAQADYLYEMARGA